MLLGYNTNGFAHHDPFEALEDPGRDRLSERRADARPRSAQSVSTRLGRRIWSVRQARCGGWDCGARSKQGRGFCSIRGSKHEPTLFRPTAAERQRRIDFLQRAIDAAAVLDSDCVSLWSGMLRDGRAGAKQRLERLARVAAASCYGTRRTRRHARLRAGAGHVHRHDEVVSSSCCSGSTRRTSD